MLRAAAAVAVTLLALTGCSGASEPDSAADLAAEAEAYSEIIRDGVIEAALAQPGSAEVMGVRCDGVRAEDFYSEEAATEKTTGKDPVQDLATADEEAAEAEGFWFEATCILKREAGEPLVDAGVTHAFQGIACAPQGTIKRDFNYFTDSERSGFPADFGDITCLGFELDPDLEAGRYFCDDDEFPDCPTWLEAESSRNGLYEDLTTQVYPAPEQ